MVNGKRKPMRQGQQNRRGRGRGRKSQNPLSRNYESNGPEVKIRGNASHIAEKYSTLARDALVSGDPVTAENFLQHAEHYYRIIMAAQAQAPAEQPSDSSNGSGGAHKASDGSSAVSEEASGNKANGSEAEAKPVEAKASNGGSKAESNEDDDEETSSNGAPSDNAAA